jgi:hypothetical protein
MIGASSAFSAAGILPDAAENIGGGFSMAVALVVAEVKAVVRIPVTSPEPAVVALPAQEKHFPSGICSRGKS